MNTNSKPNPIYRMVPLSMTLRDLDPDFKVMTFWSRIWEKWRVLKKSYYFTLIGNYT